MATLSSATLKLWIYDGVLGGYDPTSPNYTITKTKLNSEETILFEIGELVKDYIPIQFTGDYGTAKITSWVSYQITNTFDDTSTSIQTGDLLGTHGYGYFEDEINPQLSGALQQSNTCIYWKKGEKVRVPLYSGFELYGVEWYEGDVVVSSDTSGASTIAITADTDKYTADNISTLTADKTHLQNTQSTGFNVSVYAPVGATKAIITTRDNTQIELNVTYIDECKNTPYKITFLNKFGSLQDIWFFGRRKENANVNRESFRVNTIEATATTKFYSTYKPTDKIHNVDSKKSLILNTGFLCSDYNEIIQQLMQSTNVWIHENNKVYPVIPTDNTIDYKDERYDKLLNFTVKFDYAYSEINLVR